MAFLGTLLKRGMYGAGIGAVAGGLYNATGEGSILGGMTTGAFLGLGAGIGASIPWSTYKKMWRAEIGLIKMSVGASKLGFKGLTKAVKIPGVVAGASILGVGYTFFGGPDVSGRSTLVNRVGQTVGLPYGTFSIDEIERRATAMSEPQDTQLTVNYNRQALAAESLQGSGIAPTGQIGTFPQMAGPMHRAFQNSTMGLVNGLHQRRHS